MKGFAKVFFLVTMLFLVTSLFASVHKHESVKTPPGYSMSIDAQAPVVDLQNAFVFTVSNQSNSTPLNFGIYNAELIEPAQRFVFR